MDRVQRLLAAIAVLAPAEKERLFALLAKQEGPLAGRSQSPPEPARPSQPNLLPGASTPARLSAAPPDYLLIFDGGSRGNPGPGYGSYALIQVRKGSQRIERLELGQDYTNNEAEYDTLLAALESLLRQLQKAGHDPATVSLEVRGDSALVINQLQGQWKAKEPRMRLRRDRCLQLLGRFGAVRLKAQPREESVRVLGH